MLRVHHAVDPGLALGRYHRLDARNARIARRVTGGRAVAAGPGLIELTLVAPASQWLDPEGGTLGPERILNRSLRPLLGVLRAAGVDAFYPGRDLVTVGGRTLACAAFTVLPDGLLLVEQVLAVEESLGALASRLAELDPDGVAAIDAGVFQDALALSDLGPTTAWGPAGLVEALAAEAERCWRCRAETPSAPPPAFAAVQRPSDAAYVAFRRERGPLVAGRASSAALTMLGVVELAATVAADGRLRDVEISGDLIAPYATLEDLAAALDGARPTAAHARRRLAPLLADPRHFVLGSPDLAELVERLA